MGTQKFSKFIRPEAARPGQITDRDLDIFDAVLRYRFCSAAQIVRLTGGNEDVTHRRLRRLWECGLVARWAFPGLRTHSEFYAALGQRHMIDRATSDAAIREARHAGADQLIDQRRWDGGAASVVEFAVQRQR